MLDRFFEQLTEEERHLFADLDTPRKIQDYLDKTPYSTENDNRSPLSVLREGVAHCLDGGLFAAVALRRIGFPPVLVNIFPEPGTDDDHVLAIFRIEQGWGAVAKSNFVGLRYRDAVYRSLRELVMSYFHDCFNLHGQKTLRSYTRPLNLEPLDKVGWMWSNDGADAVEKRLLLMHRIPLLTPKMVTQLSPVDEMEYKAGMLSVNPEGLYQPKS